MGHRLPRVGIAPQTGRGFRHGQRPDARQDHRRIFKQLPPDVPHNHEHNPFGFHRAHFQSLRYVLDKIFFGRFGKPFAAAPSVLNRWGEKEFLSLFL